MTEPIPLHYVWQYTDVDRRFWDEYLEDWVPDRIIDAHTHVTNKEHRLEPMTEEKRRQFWVAEVSEPIDAEAVARCLDIVFPGREVGQVALAPPSLSYDLEAANEYLRRECLERGWHALSACPPAWTAERVAEELDKPGVLGLKPYYTLIGRDRKTRDKHLEAGIFDYLPHHILEVADDRRAWITLHVPKAERLPHPDNIREVKEIRRRYPNVILVIAHLGRCYTEPHAREGIPPLAEDDGLYFDISAVLNPATLRIAMREIGPDRLLYGSDNPVFYMRGRRQWEGRRYINRTSYPFHFNEEREDPEIEANYTLYMYEALKALKEVCAEFDVGPDGVRAIMHDNADRLIESALPDKRNRG